MSRTVRVLDRVATLVVGLGLVVVGLALLDWRNRWVGTWQDRLSTARFADVESTWWWPWAFAAAGVVLAVLGAAWLLAHAPRRADRTVRLADTSDGDGTVRVDLASVADAMASAFQAQSGLTDVRGSVRRRPRGTVIELRGRVDPEVPTTDVAEAAAAARSDLAAAFPGGDTSVQVLLDPPRRRRGPRAGTPRVR